MKVLLTILLLLGLNVLAIGQNISQTDTLKTQFGLEHLRHLDSVCRKQIILREFGISDGFGGYFYTFDSLGIFRRTDFDCVYRAISDSGTYQFKDNNQIRLVSNLKSAVFNIFQFDKFLFLVQPHKTEAFKKEFLATCKLYNKLPPCKSEYNHHNTQQFFIACNLAKKYLVNSME